MQSYPNALDFKLPRILYVSEKVIKLNSKGFSTDTIVIRNIR